MFAVSDRPIINLELSDEIPDLSLLSRSLFKHIGKFMDDHVYIDVYIDYI